MFQPSLTTCVRQMFSLCYTRALIWYRFWHCFQTNFTFKKRRIPAENLEIQLFCWNMVLCNSYKRQILFTVCQCEIIMKFNSDVYGLWYGNLLFSCWNKIIINLMHYHVHMTRQCSEKWIQMPTWECSKTYLKQNEYTLYWRIWEILLMYFLL